VDDLGRPFPDPLILRRARGWTGAGVVLSGAGAGLVLTGLTLGSALARGEIAPVPGAGGIVGGIFGFGLGLAVAGVPLLAAGPFTVRQLQRTIRGAEKVPRTVANESRYWRAYLTRQYALAFQVAGGGAVLLGVLSSVAVGVLVGTERYDPAYWGIVAGGFGGGAVLIIGGLALSKRAVAAMEAVRDEVDPLRQDAPESSSLRVLPQVGPPLPSFGVRRDESGQDEVFGSLRWTLLF